MNGIKKIDQLIHITSHSSMIHFFNKSNQHKNKNIFNSRQKKKKQKKKWTQKCVVKMGLSIRFVLPKVWIITKKVNVLYVNCLLIIKILCFLLFSCNFLNVNFAIFCMSVFLDAILCADLTGREKKNLPHVSSL